MRNVHIRNWTKTHLNENVRNVMTCACLKAQIKRSYAMHIFVLIDVCNRRRAMLLFNNLPALSLKCVMLFTPSRKFFENLGDFTSLICNLLKSLTIHFILCNFVVIWIQEH